MEDKKSVQPHGISLQDRKKLICTGVTDVMRFNEQSVLLETAQGKMAVGGNNLQITKLNLENGDVEIEGTVDAIQYHGSAKGKGTLSRLFK